MADLDEACELCELAVTDKAFNELNELNVVVDDKAELVVALLECQCNNQLCCECWSPIK